jgi:hypothetical protein
VLRLTILTPLIGVFLLASDKSELLGFVEDAYELRFHLLPIAVAQPHCQRQLPRFSMSTVLKALQTWWRCARPATARFKGAPMQRRVHV